MHGSFIFGALIVLLYVKVLLIKCAMTCLSGNEPIYGERLLYHIVSRIFTIAIEL